MYKLLIRTHNSVALFHLSIKLFSPNAEKL